MFIDWFNFVALNLYVMRNKYTKTISTMFLYRAVVFYFRTAQLSKIIFSPPNVASRSFGSPMFSDNNPLREFRREHYYNMISFSILKIRNVRRKHYILFSDD